MRLVQEGVKLMLCAWHGIAVGLFVSLLLFAGTPAQAAPTPEVQNGLTWLQSQVQADGSLVGESVSIATPLQARAESLTTFKLLTTVPSSLAGAITANTEDNTEYLARQVIASILAGQNADAGISALLARQNTDGGFGGDYGFDSNPLDTAWVLLALIQNGLGEKMPSVGARLFLTGAILADGGVNGPGEVARIEASAIALLALQANQADSAVANIVKNLAASLLQRQGADGGWENDAYLTAVVLSAISPVTADSTILATAHTFLISRQFADGSWNEDPFLTAVILRSLSTLFTTPSVTTGVLKGQLKDSATNVPLSGVSITLSGQDNQAVVTDVAGNFTISGLAAGTYSVTYARSGYGAASASYTIIGGQTSDVGIIGLTQLASIGIVRGQVTLANGNTPLAGVTISVTGGASASTMSDVNGQYELTGVTPGVIAITASLAGYQTVSSSGTVIAGQTLVFSPTIYANGQTVPSTIHYVGTVVSAGQAIPLAGVAIQITGASTVLAVTTSTGQFDVTLSPGSYSANFTLPGYAPITQMFIASAGAILDTGNVALSPIRTSTSVIGRVVDASNQSVSGALVQVVGTSAVSTTDADGRYAITGIIGTNFALRASAIGYNAQMVGLQVSVPSDLLQNFVLTTQTTAEITLTAFTSDESHYGAYAPVSLQIQVQNNGVQTVQSTASVLIVDPDGNVVETMQVTWVNTDGIIQREFAIPVGVTNMAVTWNTKANKPGAYTIIARIYTGGMYDHNGGAVIERQTSFVIDSTQSIGGMALTPLPSFTSLGATEPILFKLDVINRSNIPVSTDISYQLQTPSSAVVYSGTGTINLLPSEETKSIVLNGISYTFVASGHYPASIQTSNGPVPASITANAIAVAPGIRIDPSQQIIPAVVTPDGDKGIQVNIRLKGVELQ